MSVGFRSFPLPSPYRTFPLQASARTGPLPFVAPSNNFTKMLVLFEVDWPSGTRYYSFAGVAAPSIWYKDQLTAVGAITRAISPTATLPTFSDATVDLSNVDREFSILRATNEFRGIATRIRFGLAGAGLASMLPIFSGSIYQWKIANNKLRLTLRDSSYDRFRGLIGNTEPCFTTAIFPSLPTTTPPVLVPILRGTLRTDYLGTSTLTGAAPAYLIDTSGPTGGKPYRYCISQSSIGASSSDVFNVYKYGAPLDPSHWAVWTATYGGRIMFGIDIDADPRDPTRSNDLEISVDASWIPGVIGTNPVRTLQYFLLDGPITSADLDIDSWNTAAALADTLGYSADFVLTDRGQAYADIIGQFNQSFILWLYTNRLGKYGVFLFDVAPVAAIYTISDQDDIVKDSFGVDSNPNIADAIQYNYNFNAVKGRYETQPIYPTDAAIQTRWSFAYVRDAVTASLVAQRRLALYSEAQDYAQFGVPIEDFNLDLNQYIKLTHFQGISSDGRGWREQIAQVIQLQISVQPSTLAIQGSVLIANGYLRPTTIIVANDGAFGSSVVDSGNSADIDIKQITYAELRFTAGRPLADNYACLQCSGFPAPLGPFVSAEILVIAAYVPGPNVIGPFYDISIFNARNDLASDAGGSTSGQIVQLMAGNGVTPVAKAVYVQSFTAAAFASAFPGGHSDIWVRSRQHHTLFFDASPAVKLRVHDCWIKYFYA